MTNSTAAQLAHAFVYGTSVARMPAFVPGNGDDLVACIIRTSEEATDVDSGTLAAVSRSTRAVNRISPSDLPVERFAYSRDGQRLALIAGTDRQLMHAEPAGFGAALSPDELQSTSVTGVEDVPTWSPSGDSVAFTTRPSLGAPSDIAHVVTGPIYKEDGYGLIGQNRRQVAVYDFAKESTRFATTSIDGTSHPRWSPDGTKLAVRAACEEGWPWGTVEILDGSDGTRLARLDGYLGTVEDLLFLDDRHVLIFGSDRRPWTGQIDVLVWSFDDEVLRPAVLDLPWQLWVYGFHVSASPAQNLGGDEILVSGVRHGRSGLYRLSIRDGSWTRIYEGTGLNGGLALDGGGAIAVQEQSSISSFGELVEIDLNNGAARPLTELNANYFAASPRLEHRQFTTISHGVGIEAWVLRDPAAGDEGPLVLDVHGGPHNFYGAFFVAEHHMLARAGATVVYCNPRGSASYGSEFATATANRWGEDDTDDLLSVLSAARSQLGEARPVVVAGWSYGGFQVLTLLSRTPDTFRAAICGAPAAHFETWYGTTDAPSMVCEEVGGRPDELPAEYAARSPAHHLRDVRTPLLLLHGENDMRSPIAQTEIVHRALSGRSRSLRYVRYPGASHGFRHTGRPAQRAHVLTEIVSWVQRHAARSECTDA